MERGVFCSPFFLTINTLYRHIMEIIEIKTLIDVTNTDVRRPSQGSAEQLNQYKNWITLMQAIGLRAIVDYDRDPKFEIVDVKNLGFGSEFKGQHKVWTFQFRPDRPDAFATDDSTIGLLEQDLNKVPVIVNLTETINIVQPVFELTDKKLANTVVRAI